MSGLKRRDVPAALTAALGHDFKDPDVLWRALSHASLDEGEGQDNERLEFLGDRVLGLIVAQALLERFPQAAEGELALRLNAAVRREACAEVARQIDLGAHMRLAKAEAATGGRAKPAILADACEALIAALYLDGGLEVARAFVLKAFATALKGEGVGVERDAKTALQEWSQGKGFGLPRYEVIAREGPDHAPLFTIRASVDVRNGPCEARAQGTSRRAAEQAAARDLLDRLKTETT